MDLSQTEAPPPNHVAVIMDGNGRWAKSRGLPRLEGHRRGVNAVRETIEGAAEAGVRYLTLFSFSSENWRRPPAEVAELMRLLKRYLRSEIAELHAKGLRCRVIGDRSALETEIVRLIEDAERRTADNDGMTLIVALNYGSRSDIAAAARKLATSAALGLIKPEAIDQDVFSAHLDTAGVPDPDLLIRTSGEQRISNFLLWECAYTEFVFTSKYWPDFEKADLAAALREYAARDRRYGGLSASRIAANDKA